MASYNGAGPTQGSGGYQDGVHGTFVCFKPWLCIIITCFLHGAPGYPDAISMDPLGAGKL